MTVMTIISLRNPNGFEYCNNIDDNCDGTIDELAVDSTDYFVDADGDGHGALVDQSSISFSYPNGYDLISCPTFDPITNLQFFQQGTLQRMMIAMTVMPLSLPVQMNCAQTASMRTVTVTIRQVRPM